MQLSSGPEYRRRFQGDSEPGHGQGAGWEGWLTELQMYRDDARNLRYIPVLFDAATDAVAEAHAKGKIRSLPNDMKAL